MNGPAAIKFSKGLPSRPQYGERARLFVAQGPDMGAGFCLLGDRILVGRDDSDVALVDPNVSRRHIEFRWDGKSYSVKDLGSANGLIVNKKRVLDAEIKNGDVLMIGASIIEVVPPGVAKGRMVAKENKKLTESGLSLKASVAKKRTMVMFALVMLVLLAYSASENKVETFRERGKIEIDEIDNKNTKKLTAKEKKQRIKDAQEAIKEITTGAESTVGQRQDANRFFKDGAREYNNRNYRRAIIAFETALTVDPSHNMAKLYLKSAKTAFDKEIKETFKAAVKAHKALRFSEARMHYENVLRFLENDKQNEMYVSATKALNEIEVEEARSP